MPHIVSSSIHRAGMAVTSHDPRLGSWLKTAIPGAPTFGAALDAFQNGHLSAVLRD
jgi:hypothetical protein